MLKFLVFADLHYKKGMYATKVSDLEAILDRAAREKADFVVHLGDLCNDYLGSPEILRTILQNRHSLPVYGVLGNHELESEGNSLEVVIPQLCNRPVTFAGEKKAYWYADLGEYRLIAMDTNHSYNENLGKWEHNHTNTVGHPEGNIHPHSVGPEQLRWLDSILTDADEKQKKCIILTHASLSGIWDPSPDSAAALAVIRNHPGRVLMVLNGHNHTDHFAIIDNVAFLDVNTVRNGRWRLMPAHHYTDDLTYDLENYDAQGNPSGVHTIPINTLTQAINTWFFNDPLSAVVTISDDNIITVDGQQTFWMFGIGPYLPPDGCRAQITSQKVTLA